MGIETGLSLRQTQRLTMTPMLQAAIKLLQLSRIELLQILQQHVTENPLLEEEASSEWGEHSEDGMEEPEEKGKDELEWKSERSDLDWESYLESASDSYLPVSREDKGFPSFENFLSQPRSISEHLLMQLYISTAEEKLIQVGDFIIGNLDENGYLRISLEEVAGETGASQEEVEKALHLIQGFDPPGIAARDLRECLLLQLRELKQEQDLAGQIVSHFLRELEGKKWNEIARKLNVPLSAVKEAILQLSKLDPKPGRSFSPPDPQYIIPDILVYKMEGNYVIALNDEGLPRLRISPYYRKIMREKRWDNPETREYIEEKMRQALWLIRSIGQRQRTLYKVAESLVKFQKRFLDDGIRYLRPLTLKEVAEDISMHESTVSRITTNKYIYTPQGIFELKYFFHRGLSSHNGAVISSVNVKEQLRRVIDGEGNGGPISDQRLARLLNERGIHISRRTVAKYRAQLKIPASNRRKRL
ncbi:MAG: RNA polymerase factor sigma-54 [candidate division NC10 bacterium]|nr:RNA polymerase factor sigma-54 [candidate division NC10 bacterium]